MTIDMLDMCVCNLDMDLQLLKARFLRSCFASLADPKPAKRQKSLQTPQVASCSPHMPNPPPSLENNPPSPSDPYRLPTSHPSSPLSQFLSKSTPQSPSSIPWDSRRWHWERHSRPRRTGRPRRRLSLWSRPPRSWHCRSSDMCPSDGLSPLRWGPGHSSPGCGRHRATRGTTLRPPRLKVSYSASMAAPTGRCEDGTDQPPPHP